MNISPVKIDKYIEIVTSSDPRLNAMAQSSRLSVRTALSKRYTNVNVTVVDTMSDLRRLVAKKPDLVVLGMKLLVAESPAGQGKGAEVWISDYLQENNITFSGSTNDALNLQFNKQHAKQRVMDDGLHSSAYFTAESNQPIPAHNLRFPLFVKPSNSGASKVIDEKSVVYSQLDLELKIQSIHSEHDTDVLVEEYLSGREFSVAVVQQPGLGGLKAMPIEITTPADAHGHSFLSESVKKADMEKVLAVNDPVLKESVSRLAINTFKALGSRDYGRIDIRLDAHGIPHFIEANLMPGLSSHGYLARCFRLNKDIGYDQMIQSLIGLGLERSHALAS